jgi:hypothetical protein
MRKATPPMAPTATATSGGARHTVRTTKLTKVMAKSAGPLTELVHTGRRAPREQADDAGVNAAHRRLRLPTHPEAVAEWQRAHEDQEPGRNTTMRPTGCARRCRHPIRIELDRHPER